jgi:hypothetical protein
VPSWVIGGLSLLPAFAVRHPVCIRPSCTSWSRRLSRTAPGRGLDHAPPWWVTSVAHHPRGPRSGPGCFVPVRHHLIGPIRPTREHITISPHGGLYAMPSLCGSAEATRGWFRAFAAHSFLACRPLRPRGVQHRNVPELRCRHGLRRLTTGSAHPKFPQSVPRGLLISWLHWFASATACQVARPPARIRLGRPSPRGLLLPGFRRIGLPPRRWI